MTASQDILPILRNPFHVVGVGPRDTRQRIVEAAETRSLTLDPELCAKARADLTNPRNRLAAELAWLPGLAPDRARQLIAGLASDPAAIFQSEGLPPLAHANLMASAMLALDPALPERDWVVAIVALGKTVDAIAPETVVADINQDRTAAGFGEVRPGEALDEGLRERRRDYRDCLRGALDRLPSQTLATVATEVAAIATNNGKVHPPVLIDEMIDAYAVGAHTFLSKEAGNVLRLVEHVRRSAPAGDAALEPLVTRMEQVIRNWCSIARPIQLVAAAKGTAHGLSDEIAGAVRNVGVALYNERQMLDASRRVVGLVQDAFAGLPEVAERVGDDVRALDDLARKKHTAEKGAAVFLVCRAAAETVARSPRRAGSEGREVLDTGKKLIKELAGDGLDAAGVADLEDVVADTVLRCAIVLGNAGRWRKVIGLLEEALALAHGKEVRGRIETSLTIARENHRLGDLRPLAEAPALSTLNGFGCRMHGHGDLDARTRSFMTTYCFFFMYIPIFPIRRYRVIAEGRGYRFLGRAPLRPFDWLHRAASLAVVAGGLVALYKL
jgi:hypothetical protein